jgi:hypothetical protein
MSRATAGSVGLEYGKLADLGWRYKPGILNNRIAQIMLYALKQNDGHQGAEVEYR